MKVDIDVLPALSIPDRNGQARGEGDTPDAFLSRIAWPDDRAH
jgi:hypothetical protein